MRVRDHQSVVGGLALVSIGLFATVHARQYNFGTISHMGPGFFPTILGVLLAFLGALIFLFALRSPTRGPIDVQWRSLGFVLAAILVFAFTLQTLGLVLSVFIAVVMASLSDRKTGWRQRLILAVCITTFTVLIFKYLLGMVLPLGWWVV